MVIRNLAELNEWLAMLPDGTLLPVNGLRDIVSALSHKPPPAQRNEPLTWRERLWSAPEETLLSVAELAEALGKSRSWIYKRTMAAHSADIRLPYRRLDSGNLEFVVGDIRAWIERVSRENN